MAPNSSKACEGYFISLLLSTFTVCSPTLRVTFLSPQSVTAFDVARKGRPKMIGAWLSSLVIFISMTRKSTGKYQSSILIITSSTTPWGFLTNISAKHNSTKKGCNSPT